jgi:hypothetical protein
MSMMTGPLLYQPMLPVENSLGEREIFAPAMSISMGLAFSRKCARVIAMTVPCLKES